MKQDNQRLLMLVQAIVVWWTKASRGTPGATLRNRAPEVLALPSYPPNTPWPARYRAPEIQPRSESIASHTPDLFLHMVSYGERNHFQEPVAQYWTGLTTRLPESSTLHMGHWRTPPIMLAGAENGVRVRFSWHVVPGAPPRHHLHLWEQAVLVAGKWMQIRFNARHVTDEGDWYYEKHTLNIGVMDTFAPRLFINGSPDYRFSDMANLH